MLIENVVGRLSALFSNLQFRKPIGSMHFFVLMKRLKL